jgi:aconitate decarboxylase
VTYTSDLATYAATLQFETIPADVIERLQLHLLDAAGAATYGHQQPWSESIRTVAANMGGPGKAQVWYSDLCLTPSLAAFANSTATHAFELDDRRIASYMHPASAVLPSVLAIADELGGVSGRQLITAAVAGYEVGLRVGKCIGQGSFARGFYPPGIGGSFAAAAAAANLLELTADEVAAVFNFVATQAAGLYSPTMVKRFNLGRGTFNGLHAIDLVKAGFTGVDDIFDREFGSFPRAYADDAPLDLLTAGLGQSYEVMMVELKPYVSSRPNHAAIDATLDLRASHPEIALADITHIDIVIGTTNYEYGAGFPVTGVPSALMSEAYCAGVALLDGDAFLDQFTEQRVLADDIQDVLRRTEVVLDPAIDDMGLEDRDYTVVRWQLGDGRSYEASRKYAKGHPNQALSTAEVEAKFRRLTQDTLAPTTAAAMVDAFLHLPTTDSESLRSLLQPNAGALG